MELSRIPQSTHFGSHTNSYTCIILGRTKEISYNIVADNGYLK